MLIYISSGFNEYLVCLEDDRVDFTSDIAFKATDDFDLAHSFCGSTSQAIRDNEICRPVVSSNYVTESFQLLIVAHR